MSAIQLVGHGLKLAILELGAEDSIRPGRPFSVKCESQQTLVSIGAFLRRSISEPFSRSAVGLCGDCIAPCLVESLEVGSFRRVLPERPVEVLVASSFP